MLNSLDIFFVIENIKSQLPQRFSMEILITMCWAIWTSRNDKIFRGMDNSIQRCKMTFKKEFAQVILRARKEVQPLMSLWLDAFV